MEANETEIDHRCLVGVSVVNAVRRMGTGTAAGGAVGGAIVGGAVGGPIGAAVGATTGRGSGWDCGRFPAALPHICNASIHQRYQSELRVGTELPDSGCRSWSNFSQSAARHSDGPRLCRGDRSLQHSVQEREQLFKELSSIELRNWSRDAE